MVVPIFNSMMRIDKRLVEAAYDAGASGWQTLWNLIIPLSKPGIVIGSIFVVTIVMGDFITFDVMGGEQIASAGKVVETRLNALQFPPAAANAVILLGGHAADHRRAQPHRRRAQGALRWARTALPPSTGSRLSSRLRAVSLWPDDRHLHPVVPGADRRPDLPDERACRSTGSKLWQGGGIVDIHDAFVRSLELGLVVMVLTVLLSLSAGLAFRKRFAGSNLLFFVAVASLIVPSIVTSLGIALEFRLLDDFLKKHGPPGSPIG